MLLFSTFWLDLLALEESVAFCRNGNIAWFFILLIHIRPLDLISNHNKRKLLGIHMGKVDSKNTRARCETCLKLKLKNTGTTLLNGVLLFVVDYYLSSSLVLRFLLMTLCKWRMGMWVHFNNRYKWPSRPFRNFGIGIAIRI